MTVRPNPSKRTCPTCGTQLRQGAQKCLVCGTQLTEQAKKPQPAKEQRASIQGSRMPTMTMSAPLIVILLVLFIGIGSVITYLALTLTGSITQAVETSTPTQTLQPTTTPTLAFPTLTASPLPSPTPFSYTVQENDTCLAIAFTFNTSVISIVTENGLSADCTNLSVGQTLRIPQPTPTQTPVATNTPSSQQATIEACDRAYHVVQQNETLSIIALIYEVPMETILEWSGKSVDTAFFGETLTIPLCLRSSVAGATVTPSPAPDYPAPELLRPRDGEAFTLANDVVTLQWAAVSELQDNESYLVSIFDLTSGTSKELVVSIKDTKYVVPESLRPKDDLPHIFRWSVVPVAQVGVNEDGSPRYRESGPRSQPSYFSWLGSASATTPQP